MKYTGSTCRCFLFLHPEENDLFARRPKRAGGLSLSYINHERKFNINILYQILQWIFLIFIAVFLGVALVFAFGIRTSVVGESMEPSLTNGQEVLINKIAYQFAAPVPGDVIVFRPNGNENAHLSVKRVVATPGDTVQIIQGKVVINGAVYTGDRAEDTRDAGVAGSPIVLGADEYFVLGDNRNNSEDSRSANIGNISRGMIEGKAWYRLKFKNLQSGRIK
ncbi:MAG: signal peptidase I [Lachnospiraceae bacterium]|nr:signal peptidase I [Lachnospiraceae bacterium]